MKNEKLKFKDLKAQIITDLNATRSQKQFINTLDFYFRCNNNWKGYRIKYEDKKSV